jgi:hypothetical protein
MNACNAFKKEMTSLEGRANHACQYNPPAAKTLGACARAPSMLGWLSKHCWPFPFCILDPYQGKVPTRNSRLRLDSGKLTKQRLERPEGDNHGRQESSFRRFCY